MPYPELSLIVPCFRDADHLERHTLRLLTTLESCLDRWEIVLVSDASDDECGAIIDRMSRQFPQLLRAVHHPENRGRGAAVKSGLLAARGRYAGYVDIDLEIAEYYIPAALQLLQEGADAVLAERHCDPLRRGLLRWTMSRGYNILVRAAFGSTLRDTEAGFKFFRVDRCRTVIDQSNDDHWFFDTEIAYRMERAGLTIRTVPVAYVRANAKASTLRLFRDSVRQLRSLEAFRRIVAEGDRPRPAAVSTVSPLPIPFHVRWKPQSELGQVVRCLHGETAGGGELMQECERRVGDLFREDAQPAEVLPHVLLTGSGTSALEIAAVLAKLGPGDEFIVPSYAFTTSAASLAAYGARPVFVDVKASTFTLDPEAAARAISPRTRALCMVNYNGVAPDGAELRDLCDRHDLVLIEDHAHGPGGFGGELRVGLIGDVAILSFHETKNLACGEGGALLVNREDWIDRATTVRDKGTNRAAFMAGRVPSYEWVDFASGARPSALLAAQLLAQPND